MKRGALALCSGFLLLGLLPGFALATVPGTLDQSNDPTIYNVSGPATLAQTFTAGLSGPLSSVDLYIRMQPAASVNVSIEGTALGVPDGTVVATTSASVSVTEAWVNFPFSTPPNVTSGTVYAIVFSANNGDVGASADTAYSGGEALRSPSGSWLTYPDPALDFAFRTYVTVAESQSPLESLQGATATAGRVLTPPPTSTAGPTSGDPGNTIWLLPITLFTLCGGLCLLISRQRRRILLGSGERGR